MNIKVSKIKFSENFLDKWFQKVLLPTRITQHMFFLSKFSIKSNCIMPNSILYNLISLAGMLFFMFLNLNNGLIRDIFQTVIISKFLYFVFITSYLASCTGFVLFYILNVLQSNKHVRMIVTIQKAYRIIYFDNYRNFIFENWTFIFRHCIAYLLLIYLRVEITVIIYYFSLVYFDVYMSYGVCLSKLLRGGVLAWTSEVQYHTRRSLNINIDEEKTWTKLLQVYKDLMEAFTIFKDVFKIQIFFTTCDTLFHTLLYVQTFLVLDRTTLTEDGTKILATFRLVALYWLFKNLTLLTIFCSNCEKFYKTIEEVNAVCCQLLTITQKIDGSKRLCKNVLRLNQVTFQKMNALRIFTVDSNLPKKLACLIVNHVIVLLQLALSDWLKQ